MLFVIACFAGDSSGDAAGDGFVGERVMPAAVPLPLTPEFEDLVEPHITILSPFGPTELIEKVTSGSAKTQMDAGSRTLCSAAVKSHTAVARSLLRLNTSTYMDGLDNSFCCFKDEDKRRRRREGKTGRCIFVNALVKLIRRQCL